MARKLRVEYPGAIYHVLNRGDRREPIFRDDLDRQGFLATLGEACGRSGWQVHAYVLMPNHFHLVVETPQPTLVAGMKWFLGTYTGRFNRRHKLFGHLFSGRYKSLIVDGSGSGYLRTVCAYVHLNPARAKLLGPDQPLKAYRWSSWPEYLKAPSRRPGWLRVDRVLGEMGLSKDSAAGSGGIGQLSLDPTGVVFRRSGVEAGVAGADQGADGARALRAGAAGKPGGAGGARGGGGVESPGLDGGDAEETGERGSGEGEDRGAVTAGNAGDGGVDCGAIADGERGERPHAPVPLAEERKKVRLAVHKN